MFQQLDQGRHSDAIIDRICQDGSSNALELTAKSWRCRRWSAFSTRASVDEKRIKRYFSLTLIAIHQMDRVSAYHPGCASFAH